MELSEHLFRHEAGRIVATLTCIFGVHNVALAEDVAQEVFCRALEIWKFRGVPENPPAWLMTTAKHRAIDVLRRERTALTFEPELSRLIQSEWTRTPAVEGLFATSAIKDDLLQMMFGILLAVIGTALVIGEWRGPLAFAVLTLGYVIKARKEEPLMVAHFGTSYQEYTNCVGFLWPRIRRSSRIVEEP